MSPNIDSLDFAAGKAAYSFGQKQLSGRVSDNTPTTEEAGDYFEYQLEAKLRNIHIDMETLRAKLRNRAFHVYVKYYDDSERVFPYMRLAAKGDSGEKPGTFQGYTLAGSLRSAFPAPFIGATPTINDGLPPEGSGSDAGEVLKEVVTTSSASATFTLPAGALLAAVSIRSDQDQTVSVGLTFDGEELGGPQDILADQGHTFAQSFRAYTDTTLHFSGLAGSNSIEVWYVLPGAGDVVIISITTSDPDYEYSIPEGVLLGAVCVRGSAAQTVSVGLTSGGEELGGPQSLAANEGHTFAQTLRTYAATPIFISGLAGNNSIEIWYYL